MISFDEFPALEVLGAIAPMVSRVQYRAFLTQSVDFTNFQQNATLWEI